MSVLPAICSLCGADWRKGEFTGDCRECDGGAMDRPCLACNGQCGARSLRSVHDSQDAGIGEWAVKCNLWPPEGPFNSRRQ
jgi:hypothetical protein